MSTTAGKREYRSELRQRQAGETRHRIVTEAAALFADLGYARTTLTRIAERAGVSVETVQTHGPKAALLRAAVEVAGFGVEGARNATDLDAGRALLELGRDQLPDGCAAYLLAVHSKMAGLVEALVGGAANDPELREYQADMTASIRRQYRDLFDILGSRGWLRETQPRDQLVDVWCVSASPETYVRLVRDYGWTGEQYAAWLADTFRVTVLAAGS